jgi:hypothetical protein
MIMILSPSPDNMRRSSESQMSALGLAKTLSPMAGVMAAIHADLIVNNGKVVDVYFRDILKGLKIALKQRSC